MKVRSGLVLDPSPGNTWAVSVIHRVVTIVLCFNSMAHLEQSDVSDRAW